MKRLPIGKQALLQAALAVLLTTPTESAAIPKADCHRCKHRRPDVTGAHCYIFKDKPGDHCAQFTESKP